MIARARAAAAREEGRTLLLGVGLIAVVLGLVLVVASVTAIHLDLKRLTALADSAAAAAVDAAEPDGYYGGVGGGALPGLTGAGARAAAQADLGRQPAGGPEGAEIADVEIVDSTTVVVTLSARSRPPFLPWGVIPSRGFTIRADGSARAVVAP